MPMKVLLDYGLACGLSFLAITAFFPATEVLAGDQSDTLLTTTTPHETYNTFGPPLTLKDALSFTLQHSPYLAAFSQEIKARNFETLQAGLLPNPELSVEVDNVAGSGSYSGTDSAETTVRLSQRIELGGKRMLRKSAGSSRQHLAQQEFDMAQVEATASTTYRFIGVLAAQMRLALAHEEIDLASKVRMAVEDRVEAGKSTAIEAVRFQAVEAEFRLHEEKVRQELGAARRALAWALGAEHVDFGSVQGSIDTIQILPDWSELVAMLEKSPELILQQRIGKDYDHQLALEQARRLPDLTVSLGAKNDQDSGDNALIAELSIPLPLFNKNSHNIAALQSRLEKAKSEKMAAQLGLRTVLAEAFQQLQGAHSDVVLLREEIIPSSQKIFDASTYGYEAGKFGFLVVLEAQRTLFDVKERYIDSLEMYHKAVVELERILGQKIAADGVLAISDMNESR